VLHVHSTYSLLNSAAAIDDIINKAKENNINTVALTDTNSMAGLIQFAKLAKENNIKAVLGAYIDNPQNENEYVLLLAKNTKGYRALCQIITSRKLVEEFSLDSILNSPDDNLFTITPCIRLLKKYSGNTNLFGEVILTKGEKANAHSVFSFCKETGVKYVPSIPVYFINKEDHILHKTVTAIRKNSTLENVPKTEIIDEDFYLHSYNEFINLCGKLPEGLKNLQYLLDNCNVDLRLNEYKFPKFEVPKDKNSIEVLRELSYEGLSKRYNNITERESAQLEYELEVINEMNFADYFLIVWDIVKEAHKRGLVTIGRGSAANSIVSYCLNLTQVDPIKYDLYFERFLNRERKSPPDIDIDFSWKERDQIVKYVFDKYGYERVAMISTTVTFRGRSAFRETAKVFGISNEEISKYSKYIPWMASAKNLKNLGEIYPEARGVNFNIEPWAVIIDIASRIAGFPRHLSIHPSGIVITPTRVTDYCALEYAKNKGLGLIITQPDMYSIEDLGLIKIDLLSQRSLGVLRDTLNMIAGNKEDGELK
jgi:DNA polymerase III alpha subunit